MLYCTLQCIHLYKNARSLPQIYYNYFSEQYFIQYCAIQLVDFSRPRSLDLERE